jgi:hypothetical protein
VLEGYHKQTMVTGLEKNFFFTGINFLSLPAAGGAKEFVWAEFLRWFFVDISRTNGPI